MKRKPYYIYVCYVMRRRKRIFFPTALDDDTENVPCFLGIFWQISLDFYGAGSSPSSPPSPSRSVWLVWLGGGGVSIYLFDSFVKSIIGGLFICLSVYLFTHRVRIPIQRSGLDLYSITPPPFSPSFSFSFSLPSSSSFPS